MSKHRPVVEPGAAPASVQYRDLMRELSELESELRGAGMHRQAKTVSNAVKVLRIQQATAGALQAELDNMILKLATKG